MSYVPLFYAKSFSVSGQEMKRDLLLCFPGVQTPDRPEGTEEGQREETQRWAAEPQHHHV